MRMALITAVTLATTGCAAMVPEFSSAMKASAARQGTTEQSYDEFRDVRVWHLVGMNVAGIFAGGRNDAELRMGAIATETGPAHPETPNEFGIMLYFSGTSTEWQYLGSRLSMDFLIDGERLHLGDAAHDGEVGRGFVMENMALPITREQLLQLAEAQSVAGQLAHTRFELRPLHLERVRAFVAALPPVAAVAP